MNYTTKSNPTQKVYLVRTFVILNLVSFFILFQLILAPCIYAADMSKATDIFIQRSGLSPLIVAINDNQHMKEIEELEQKEKEIKEREKQTLKYKSMITTGKTLKWSAWGVGIAGLIISANVKEEVTIDPVTGEEIHEEWKKGILILFGGMIAAYATHWIGNSMVKKGERGLEGLAVSYKNNGLANEYYVSYQFNF